MPEPCGDSGDVDPGFEKVHGCGMPDDMRRDARRVPRSEPGACRKLSQDVGDARTAEAASLGVQEERPVGGAALSEPCFEGVDGSRPQGAGALLTTFALERDHRNRVQADIADIEVNDLLDAGAGVVKYQEERAIAASFSGSNGPHQLQDFVVLKVVDLWVLETGRRQLANSATPLKVLGSDGGDVARECLDRGKPMVAGACTALASFFQPDKKRTNHLDVENSAVKPIGGASGPLRGVAEE